MELPLASLWRARPLPLVCSIAWGCSAMIKWPLVLSILVWANLASAAQPQAIKVEEGKTWVHEASGLALPAAIGSFVRNDISDLSGGKQIDVGSGYREPATGTLATVYVYRPAMPLAPLWLDIASWYIQRNQSFAPVTVHSGAVSFTVAGQVDTVNLRQVYSIGAMGRSSGVAIVPLGPWMIKVRITSQYYEPRALDAALEAVVKGLGWPKRMPTVTPAANPISSCKTKLPESRADEIKQTSPMILVGAMLGSLSEDDKKDKREVVDPPRLCRDDSRTDNIYPIYHLDEGSSGYVIPIGDNGTVLAVRNDPLGAELAMEFAKDTSKDTKPFYRVTLMTPEQWEQFPAFAQLPPVEQAFDVVKNRSQLSVTKVLGERSIHLDAESFK